MTEKPAKPFEAAKTARTLIDAARTASLATLQSGDGAPFASLVAVAADTDGVPVLLLSELAVHTQNVEADPRVALLFTEKGLETSQNDPLVSARVTLTGRLVADNSADTRECFLIRHPDAQMYVNFNDFAFYRLEVAAAHLVAGFGRIESVPPERIFGAAG